MREPLAVADRMSSKHSYRMQAETVGANQLPHQSQIFSWRLLKKNDEAHYKMH